METKAVKGRPVGGLTVIMEVVDSETKQSQKIISNLLPKFCTVCSEHPALYGIQELCIKEQAEPGVAEMGFKAKRKRSVPPQEPPEIPRAVGSRGYD